MIDRLDHIVLNCRDVAATAAWYERAFGLQREVFGPDERIALKFGGQKINLRPVGAENWITGAAEVAAPATFALSPPVGSPCARASTAGVEVILGPVTRTGAAGPMTSLYMRDPDGSLVEVASYDPADRVAD